MNLHKFGLWKLLLTLFGAVVAILILVGISGRQQPVEDMISGANLPALFLYLAMGKDPDAMTGGENIRMTDEYGTSAFYNARREPLIASTLNTPFSTAKIALLTLFGADINAKTEGGDTALGLALSWQDEPSACYLLRHGAKLDGLSEADKEMLKNLKCDI